MKQRKSKQVRLLSGMLIGIVMIAVLARIVYVRIMYIIRWMMAQKVLLTVCVWDL